MHNYYVWDDWCWEDMVSNIDGYGNMNEHSDMQLHYIICANMRVDSLCFEALASLGQSDVGQLSPLFI